MSGDVPLSELLRRLYVNASPYMRPPLRNPPVSLGLGRPGKHTTPEQRKWTRKNYARRQRTIGRLIREGAAAVEQAAAVEKRRAAWRERQRRSRARRKAAANVQST